MHLLVNVNVHRAGNNRHLALDVLRDPVTGDRIARNHLHIDRRGNAEIQNLVRDIGGLKEEDFILKPLPECRAEIRCTCSVGRWCS